MIKYIHSNSIRTLKFIAPTLLYFILLLVLYSYKNVESLASYSISCLIIYLISIWISYILFTMDNNEEKKFIISLLASKKRYLLYKFIYIQMIMFAYSLVAIIYPLLFGIFSNTVSIKQFLIVLIVHLLIANFATIIIMYFTLTRLANKKYTIPGILLVSLISIVIRLIPKPISYIYVLFPPINLLTDFELYINIINLALIIIVYGILYILVNVVLITHFFEKNEYY